jgi:hypothetical protein
MSIAEGVAYCISATLMFGFLSHRLVYGWVAGGGTRAMTLERAEKRREVARNLVNILLLVAALIKFAAHLGWLLPSWKAALVPIVGIPLLLSVAVYLKAWLDVKRSSPAYPMLPGVAETRLDSSRQV